MGRQEGRKKERKEGRIGGRKEGKKEGGRSGRKFYLLIRYESEMRLRIFFTFIAYIDGE